MIQIAIFAVRACFKCGQRLITAITFTCMLAIIFHVSNFQWRREKRRTTLATEEEKKVKRQRPTYICMRAQAYIFALHTYEWREQKKTAHTVVASTESHISHISFVEIDSQRIALNILFTFHRFDMACIWYRARAYKFKRFSYVWMLYGPIRRKKIWIKFTTNKLVFCLFLMSSLSRLFSFRLNWWLWSLLFSTSI